jgi:hypothetical protein
MVDLSDPVKLRDLIDPPADTTHQRVRELLAAVYTLPFAAIDDVTGVEVVESRLQRPLFTPRRLAGTWTQTQPSLARTDVVYEGLGRLDPEWLDVSATLSVTVVLRVDPGEIESIRLGEVASFQTLAEFESRFRFFDLAGFMAEHRITTVEELRRANRYLLGEIKLKAPGPFDPADPANRRRFELPVAVLIRDVVDLTACLRDARLAREALERTLAYRRETAEGEVRTPAAPVLVLPAAGVAATGRTAAELSAFFAAQEVLAVFVT